MTKKYLNAYGSVFYNQVFYKEVVQNWKGVGFTFLLILLALLTIPRIYQVQTQINHLVENVFPELIQEFPTVTIKNGNLSINQISPLIIRDKETFDAEIIFDTSGKYISLENTTASVLITSKQIFLKNNGSHPYILEVNRYDDMVIDKEKISEILPRLSSFGIVVYFPVSIAVSLITVYFKAFLLSLVGLIFLKLRRSRLAYTTLFRLTTFSIAPGIIVASVLQLLSVSMNMVAWVVLGLHLGYLYFAVDSNVKGLAPAEKSVP